MSKYELKPDRKAENPEIECLVTLAVSLYLLSGGERYGKKIEFRWKE